MMPADGKLLADLPGKAQPAEAPPKAKPVNLAEIAIRLDTLRANAPMTFPSPYHLRAWLIDQGLTESQIASWDLSSDVGEARKQLTRRRDTAAERATFLARDANTARELRDRLDGIIGTLQGVPLSGS